METGSEMYIEMDTETVRKIGIEMYSKIGRKMCIEMDIKIGNKMCIEMDVKIGSKMCIEMDVKIGSKMCIDIGIEIVGIGMDKRGDFEKRTLGQMINPLTPRSRSTKCAADTKFVKYLTKCRRILRGAKGFIIYPSWLLAKADKLSQADCTKCSRSCPAESYEIFLIFRSTPRNFGTRTSRKARLEQDMKLC